MTRSTTSSPGLADTSTDEFSSVEEALGHTFTDQTLIELACTHRSWCAEHGGESNERLEFLGDAVLGVVITEIVFAATPNRSEGVLAKARAEVVSAPSLAAVARSIGLGEVLRLGRGEQMSGGADKDSILADAMEAVIGALHLDGSIDAARKIIATLLADDAIRALEHPGENDHKTRLQERAAAEGFSPPRYEVSSSGPDHGRRFAAVVTIGPHVGRGAGSSKKQAEQEAAGAALERLDGVVGGETGDNGEARM